MQKMTIPGGVQETCRYDTLGTRASGHRCLVNVLAIELDGIRGLFQPQQFYHPIKAHPMGHDFYMTFYSLGPPTLGPL